MQESQPYCQSLLMQNLKLLIMIYYFKANLGIVKHRDFRTFIMADIPELLRGLLSGKLAIIFKTY